MTVFETIARKPVERWTVIDYWKMRGIAFLIGMLSWLALVAVMSGLSPYSLPLTRMLIVLSVLWGVTLTVLIWTATADLPPAAHQNKSQPNR